MANRNQIRTNNYALIAMIVDEDTVVGFLLASVGNVDLRRKTNYLLVDSKTTVKQIEDAFKDFTTREDIAIVMISQHITITSQYQQFSKFHHPYDPAQDSVLSRVKHLFSAESESSRY